VAAVVQVAEWLWGQVGGGEPAPEMSVPMHLAQGLRYGENPHQSAAFYTDLSLAEAGQVRLWRVAHAAACAASF
jgi:phosphoribosylaminoimidazolecarboxamide formyltransferase/IMP cyclohydrolase